MIAIVRAVLVASLLVAYPALAAWRVAETPHFRLHSRGDADDLRAKAVGLERFWALLGDMTGRLPPADMPKLDVYLAWDALELRSALPWARDGIAGQYRSGPDGVGVLAIRAVDTGDALLMSGQDVLQHEVAHHFMYANGAGAVPRWYAEGFAEYVATARFTADAAEVGRANRGRFQALSQPTWNLEELVEWRATNWGSPYYARAWLLTHYLSRAPGMTGRLADYLARVGRGEPSVAAFRATVAPDVPALEHELTAYYYGKGRSFTRLPNRPPAVAVTMIELPAAYDDLLLPLAGLRLSPNAADARTLLERVRRAADRSPGDADAARARATAEAIGGDRAVAARLLDPPLAAAPADPELLRLRALAELPRDGVASDAQRQAARRLLVRAFAAAPDDWRVLWAYAATFPLLDAPLPPRLLEVLLRAHALAPQVAAITLHAGVALAHDGKRDAAIRTLSGVAYAPHGDPLAELARRLIDRLCAKDDAGVTALLAAFKTGGALPAEAAQPPRAIAHQPSSR